MTRERNAHDVGSRKPESKLCLRRDLRAAPKLQRFLHTLLAGFFFASAVATGGLSSVASAQQPRLLDNGAAAGMDLHLLRPALDSKGLLSLNGADILGAGDFSFGLVLDAGFGMLPFRGFRNDSSVPASQAVRTGRLVTLGLTGTLHFNYGIANLLVIGVQLPVQTFSSENVTVPGVFNLENDALRGLGYQGFGNIAIHGKIRILRPERDAMGLAATLTLEGLTGDSTRFSGEPSFAVWPALAAEIQPARTLRLVGNIGARIPFGKVATFPVNGRTVPTGTNASMPSMVEPGGQLTYGPLLTFGFGIGYRIFPSVDIDAEIYGTQVLSEFGTEGALSLEAIGGLKIFVERNSYLVVSAGAGLPTSGFQAADFRAMVGFIFEPTIGDRDGDGLRDDVDRCLDEPEDRDDYDDEDGCPEPDNDRDGILDVDDSCPLIPEDRDGDADDDGCPEGSEDDRDGDGILDSVDECPDDPEDRDDFQDQDGCPEVDNDQDGIFDEADLCRNDPEDRDGFEDDNGCPDPDNDTDLILDVDDQCPNEPETKNGEQDEDGCPDQGSVVVLGDEVMLLEKIQFETDSAEIKPESFPLLDKIAATLNGNPQLEYIEVQGHADERAADDYNIRLTRDRAASVVEALVNRGVAANRLRSAGYGERCPDNVAHTPVAWEQNRRVEFKILRTSSGPTNVEIACPAGRELIPN